MQRSLGTTTSEPLHFVWLRLLEALGQGTVAHLPRGVGVRVEPGSVPARARGHRVWIPDPSPCAQSGLPFWCSPSPFPRALTWGVVGAGDRAGRSREHSPQAGLWGHCAEGQAATPLDPESRLGPPLQRGLRRGLQPGPWPAPRPPDLYSWPRIAGPSCTFGPRPRQPRRGE
ncbi:uncharacterized protein LOC111530662 [Piliocolobus tephrosceles]|uniref:uncharacterized protein LOC111530662 n=1 Tax=Piliocolobus tephrosceles TaxID=591936 RepID=UPI000C296A5C|nr:uncharacterized protein LOC111530662 [Piliocolobus tephrosceles]